jgi:hypothetical protein
MNHTEVKRIVDALQVPKTTVASLSGCSAQELSMFFRLPKSISAVKGDRIKSTVVELQFLLTEVWPRIQSEIPLKPDLRDAEGLKQLLTYLRKTQEAEQAAVADSRESDRGSPQSMQILVSILKKGAQ